MRRSAALCVFGIRAAVHGAVDYTFTPIADSTMSGFSQGFLAYSENGPFGRTVSLNDSGDVAFYVNGPGIHVGDGTTARLVAGPANGYLSWLAAGPNTWVSMNNAGRVAFSGGGMSPTGVPFGVWSSDGVSATLIAPGGPVTFASAGPEASINDLGQVAFVRRNNDPNPGVFVSDGPTETPIVPRFTDPWFFQILGARALNNAGQVAFFGDEPQDNFAQVFRGDGTDVAGMGLLGDDFERFALLDMGRRTARDTLSINEDGVVAFWGQRTGGVEGIFLNDGGGFSAYVDESAGFASLRHWGEQSSVPVINDHGLVAFTGETSGGVRGIFAGPSPEDAVIALGDELFGSEVADLYLGHEGLNNLGQLAFVARLDDGRTFVVRADPVPEPGTLLLYGAAFALVLARRTRRSTFTSSPIA